VAGSARSAVFEVPIIDLTHTVCDDEDCFDLKVDLDERDQFSPIVVVRERARFRVVDGAKRVVAARALGWTHLYAILASDDHEPGRLQIAVAEAITNAHRKPFCWSRVARKSLVMEERLRLEGSVSGRLRQHVAEQLYVNDRTLAKARTIVALADDPGLHAVTRAAARDACERMDRDRLVDGAYKILVPYAILERARPGSDQLLDHVARGDLTIDEATSRLPTD